MAAGDTPCPTTHPNTAGPGGLPDTAQGKCVPESLNQLWVTAPSVCSNPSAHFSSWSLHCPGALSGHLNLSQTLQREGNCSNALMRTSASSNMQFCSSVQNISDFIHYLSCFFSCSRAAGANTYAITGLETGYNLIRLIHCPFFHFSSPQALLELHTVMNDPLDKLQFPALCHDLRHSASVHRTRRRSP